MVSDYKEEDIEFANRILHHRDELTEGEVQAWLAQPNNLSLLDEVAGIKRGLQKKDYTAFKAEEWGRLRRKISGRRIWLRSGAVAAAMVMVLAGTMLWFRSELAIERTGQENKQMAQIKPGKVQAEWILEDGKTIFLNNDHLNIKHTMALSDREQAGNSLPDTVKGIGDPQLLAHLNNGTAEQYCKIRVPEGGFYKLVLSDGTEVWLNAASELKFPYQFGEARREVYLKGEGYFRVAHDTLHRFVVHVKDAEVSVLGTVFNVSAYEDESQVRTTLAEGAVAFYSQQKQQQVILKPGMQSVMDVSTGNTSVAEVDPAVYSAWVDGRFVFQAMNLEAIMRQLQRWYACEVVYQNPEVKKYEFRGVINRDMEIRQVLDIIEETTDLKFVVQGKTIIVKK